jgi:hypothetical protein
MVDPKPSPSLRPPTPWLRWAQWLVLSAAFAVIGCFLLARARAELQKPGLTPVLFAAVLGGGIGYAATAGRIGSREAVVLLAVALGAGSAGGMTILRYDLWRDALRQEYLGDLAPPRPGGITDQPPPPGAAAELMRQLRRDREAKYRAISGFDEYQAYRLAGFVRWPGLRRRPDVFFGVEIALAGLAAAGAAWLVHGPRRDE